MRAPTPTQTLRIACLGAGYFAAFHYDSWARMPGARAVAACDNDLSKAKATGLAAYDDLVTMLAAQRPDLVDIIVPPSAHAQAIRTCLSHGVTRMICQKPFCISRDEARAVTAEVAQAGATLIIHENFRFQPWYRTIAAALKRGRIGRPLQACFRFRPGDGQGPDAYLARQPYFQKMERFLVHETAVHWIDTFRYLFGAPEAVYADLRRINPAIAGEDAGVILFDHPNGMRALFDGNRHLDHAASNTRRTMGEALIEGTEGSLSLDGSGAVTLRRFGEMETEELLGADGFDGFGGDCVHALNAHVVAHLHTGTPLENTAADYLPVIDIEEAIYRAAETGRKIGLEGV
ncbi:Gfo/Idh/MocA family protein [Roseobacteraceae bacterium S113]